MITTTGLVHIHHLIEIQEKKIKNSPCDETSLILLIPFLYILQQC